MTESEVRTLFWVLCILVVTIPLAFLLAWLLRRTAPDTITLSPDAIEFTTFDPFWGTETRMRVPRAEVGAAKCERRQRLLALTIDVGLKRHVVRTTGPLSAALTDPEKEWLAEAIQAWRDEH